ncbi:MAG: T9SS type A sorting domain-containing protein [Flavobacterium sp.]|nr:T9SS type A sorting domain-containing protein [Flavobacterium sp.]
MIKIFFLLIVLSFFSYSQQLTCGAQFTDNGGITGNYLANSNQTTIICPTNPTDQITVTFDSFNIEPEFDGLYVYDGLSIAAPQIASNNPAINGLYSGAFWGNTIPGPFVSTDATGCLTFIFKSDSSNQNSGWTANVSCVSRRGFEINAFIDYDGNGQQNGTNEVNFPIGEVQYEVNNNGIINHINSTTSTAVLEPNSTNSYNFNYIIDPLYSSMYQIASPSYTGVNINNNLLYTPINFPITPLFINTDLAVTLTPLNKPQPGGIYKNKIVFSNLSNQVVSGNLNFNCNSGLIVINDNSQINYTSSTSLSYDFGSLMPQQSGSIIVNMLVTSIPNVNLGDILTNSVSLTSNVTEFTQTNNYSSLTQEVVGAYDPNDITETHGSKIVYPSFAPDEYLNYVIRFENTGTAPANKVFITNVLDPKIDEISVKMVTASDNYSFHRVGNNLDWTFDNILLPIAVPNSNIGKGSVVYKAKLKPDFGVGTIIPNQAKIYFDTNPAIITNTFTTEFVSNLSNENFETDNNLKIAPNPTKNTLTITNTANIKEISIYNTLGQLLQTNIQVSKTIDVSDLQSGNYFMKIVTESGVSSQRFVKE